jgi:hypothetical protein
MRVLQSKTRRQQRFRQTSILIHSVQAYYAAHVTQEVDLAFSQLWRKQQSGGEQRLNWESTANIFLTHATQPAILKTRRTYVDLTVYPDSRVSYLAREGN